MAGETKGEKELGGRGEEQTEKKGGREESQFQRMPSWPRPSLHFPLLEMEWEGKSGIRGGEKRRRRLFGCSRG